MDGTGRRSISLVGCVCFSFVVVSAAVTRSAVWIGASCEQGVDEIDRGAGRVRLKLCSKIGCAFRSRFWRLWGNHD